MSDLDTGFSNNSADYLQANSATLDMGLIVDYCRNVKPFPTDSLLTQGVSESGIKFVRSVMAPKPRDRLTAVNALASEWFLPPSVIHLLQHLSLSPSVY